LPPDLESIGSLEIDLLPVGDADIEPSSEPARATITTDKQNSFDLCLCALIGFGLCKSIPVVKKFSWASVPEWYHDGGPFQVGHSHAIGPHCFSSASISCFIQPERTADDSPSRYCRQTIICLWRKSQFTPAVLAARGPPE